MIRRFASATKHYVDIHVEINAIRIKTIERRFIAYSAAYAVGGMMLLLTINNQSKRISTIEDELKALRQKSA